MVRVSAVIGTVENKKNLETYFSHLLAKKILAASEDVRNFLVTYWRIPDQKISVGRRGVDIDFFHFDAQASEYVKKRFCLPHSATVFIAINRFADEKRIDRLLGAFLLLVKNGLNAYLLIAGEGQLRSLYEERIMRNHILVSRIKLLGFRKDINKLISGSDFLLLASDNEGQSNVIKEAMACGTIPIVTDSSGTREISNSIFISKRNVFDFYKMIKFTLALPKEKLQNIRMRISEEIKQKYNLEICTNREIETFDLPALIEEPPDKMPNFFVKLKNYCNYFLKPQDCDFKLLDLLSFVIHKKFRKSSISIGWLLCGNENVASSRLQGIVIHNYIKDKIADSAILNKPRIFTTDLYLNLFLKWALLHAGFNILVFQKVCGKMAEELAHECKKHKIKTVYVMADYIESKMCDICDHTIVVSDHLKKVLVSHGYNSKKVSVIEDPIETPYALAKDYTSLKNGSDIKVVWVGCENNWSTLELVKDALSAPVFKNYRLVTISNHPEANMRWDSKTVWEEIVKCNIAVIPAHLNSNEALAKSSNRLTMFKAMGLPVICSPVPSYKEIIRNGENGFLAETREDWIRYLQILNDFNMRQRIGLADREKILSLFSIKNIGQQYLNIFTALLSKNA